MRINNTGEELVTQEIYSPGTRVDTWKCTKCKRTGNARLDVRGHECPTCK